MAGLIAVFTLRDNYSRFIERMTQNTRSFQDRLTNASGQADHLNDRLGRLTSGANTFAKALVGLMIIQKGIENLKKGAEIMDNYTNTAARIGLINDKLQDQEELQDKIFAAANRARGSYDSMAEAVARIGMMAGDAFVSNDELIGFTELTQKSFRLGGANKGEQDAAMLQLSQAMAAGKLQGDEFRSITENAPLILEAIKKYTGKSKGELKKMSSDGEITADIIKASMFGMSKEINDNFSKLPKAWGDYANLMSNNATRAFAPLMMAISKIINTEGFQNFVQFIINCFYLIGNVSAAIVNWIADNWTWISAFLEGALVVGIAMLVMWLWAVVPPAVVAGTTMFLSFLMAHAPLIALIVIVGMVIYYLGQMGVKVSDVIGFVVGIFAAAGTMIINSLISIWNMFATVGNFVSNVFKDPLAAAQVFFYDFVGTVLGLLESLASGIDAILNKLGIKVDVSSNIGKLKDEVNAKSQAVKDNKGFVDIYKKKEYVDTGAAFNGGFDAGKGFADDIASKFNGLSFNSQAGTDLSKLGSKGSPLKVEGTGKNGSMKVEIDDDDLKYLRDVAERDFSAKVLHKTMAPNINVKFTGPISKDVDTDKMYKRITRILSEEIAIAAEG